MIGVEAQGRMGINVKITTLERTLVDLLDRPEFGGGWEEIWRSVETIPVLDIDAVIAYALLLENATTIAKLGFFLETHQQEFAVAEKKLNFLEKYVPRSKHYMDNNKKQNNQLISRWNLVAPIKVINKTWEESGDNF